MSDVTKTKLHVITVRCPNCNAPLVYLPEIVHSPTHRHLYECEQTLCARYREKVIVGNADNFGSYVEHGDPENADAPAIR